jgi:C1A family cysteine protease
LNQGDKGYCYLPYDYITNPRLTNLAWTVKKLNIDAMDKTAWCHIDGINYTQTDDDNNDVNTEETENIENKKVEIQEVTEEIEYVECQQDGYSTGD